MAWAPDYASTAELAALVRVDDTIDDAQLALAIATASRAIDHATGRQFGLIAAAEARYYTPSWSRTLGRWTVETDDLMTSTGLAVAGDLLADGSYGDTLDVAYVSLRPMNSAQKTRPWTALSVEPLSPVQLCARQDSVKVTGRWGWTAVPTTIKQATLLQASRLLARRDSPYGIAGSPDVGSEMRLLARVDPDVAVALAPYRRWWGAL